MRKTMETLLVSMPDNMLGCAERARKKRIYHENKTCSEKIIDYLFEGLRGLYKRLNPLQDFYLNKI